MTKPLSIASLVSACVLCSVAVAQTPSKKPTPKSSNAPAAETPKPAPPPAPAETPAPPFEPVFFSTDVSPSAYRANEPRKLWAWVESKLATVPGKPDQFSTPDERQKYDAAVADAMRGIGPVAVLGPCQKKYDIDRQAFEVKVFLSSIKDYSLKSPNPEALRLRRVTLGRSNSKTDTYTAQNAYGATSEVSRTVSDDYVLTFPAGEAYEPTSILVPGTSAAMAGRTPYWYTFNYLMLNAKLAPAEARESEKQITCLYVFSLEAPYVFKFKERETPTRDMPFDQTTNGYALFGRLDRVAVVNRETGVVYDQSSRSK